jgi:hypothetical protein
MSVQLLDAVDPLTYSCRGLVALAQIILFKNCFSLKRFVFVRRGLNFFLKYSIFCNGILKFN